MTQLNAQVLHGFVKSCLVKKFDGSLETPACHLEWWDLCTSKNKYVAISAPRG